MKVTIELTSEQVKGIKAYLKQVAGIEKPTKKDIETEIRGYVNATLDNPNEAVSDYIKNI